MKEISVNDIGPIRIGQTENREAGTGCTVFISETGMRAGLDVRGGGPASRESQLLNPLTAAQRIHGIVLAGGSAFGLSAAGGVMRYLKEHDIGFDVGVTKVPLVVQSDIFDLTVARPDVYPDEAMGYEAARLAMEAPNYKDGNFGAGCGATVGKLCGMERAMKTGIGSYAVEIGELKIGAVTCVASTLGDTCHRGDAVLGVGVGGQAWENRVSVGFPFNSWQLLPVCNYHCAQTLCEPMDCSPPGSSVHGIVLARILECVAIPFPRGSS